MAKIFFEEVTRYFSAHPQSVLADVRFVAHEKEKDAVGAFLSLLLSFAVARTCQITSFSPERHMLFEAYGESFRCR